MLFSRRSARSISHRSDTLFSLAFSFEVSIAVLSMSHIYALFASKSIDAIPRIPLPVPTSITVLPLTSISPRRSRHIFVVSCSPVPNAIPGFIQRIFSFIEFLLYLIHTGTTVTDFVTMGL